MPATTHGHQNIGHWLEISTCNRLRTVPDYLLSIDDFLASKIYGAVRFHPPMQIDIFEVVVFTGLSEATRPGAKLEEAGVFAANYKL